MYERSVQTINPTFDCCRERLRETLDVINEGIEIDWTTNLISALREDNEIITARSQEAIDSDGVIRRKIDWYSIKKYGRRF